MDRSIGKQLDPFYIGTNTLWKSCYFVLVAATVWSAVASIGWYILAITISLWYAFPYVQGKYTSWKLRRDDQEYMAKYHKNPDLLQERRSALEASRNKMQEEYRAKSLHLRHEEKEERGKSNRASRVIFNNDPSDGTRSGKDNDPSFTQKRHNSIRGEYNPLMGDGARGYRPPKRSCCSKGSCG